VVCEHLRALEQELLDRGIKETYRGQTWSKNCREWAYFDCLLDLARLRARFAFAPSVIDHVHRGTHDGAEQGFVCNACWDAVVGLHPEHAKGRKPFV
jgi:hypothetical protein